MIKKHNTSELLAIVIFLISIIPNTGALAIWHECTIIDKAVDLNAKCVLTNLYIYDTTIESLTVVSYPNNISSEEIAKLSPENIQQLIFKDDSGQGLSLESLPDGEYEFLVNGKKIKIGSFIAGIGNKCNKVNQGIILIALILSFITAWLHIKKKNKKTKYALIVLITLLIILAFLIPSCANTLL